MRKTGFQRSLFKTWLMIRGENLEFALKRTTKLN